MDGAARVQVYLELKNRAKSGLDAAKKYLNKNVEDMKAKINELKTAHIESFKAMKDEIPGFGRAAELITNPYVLATAAVVALAAAFGTASQKAQEFDTKMAHANVTANESKPELAKTGNRLLNIAANSTTKDAANAAPDAYNVLLSSGMAKGDALAGVAPTLQAAKAGFTDIETTARAAAATMNSSGIKDANKVYDILFATLNKGNAEFKDIAQYLPKIVPGALQAGSSLEQVAGAFAFLTAQGQTSEKAATMLENAFKTLGDVSKAKSFQAIGVDVYDAAGKMRNMQDIAAQLQKALGGLTDKQRNTVLGSLGLDQESAGAFAALSKDANELKNTIDFTTKSAGQFKQAVENAKTPMDGWVQLSNMADVAWIKLGQKINNVVLGPLANWIVSNKDNIELFGYIVAGVAVAWGTYALVTNAAAIGTGILTAAQWALNLALTANPVGIVVVAIGALIGGLVYAYQKSEKFRAVLSGLMEVGKLLGDVFLGVGKTIIGALTFNPKLFSEGATQAAAAVANISNGGIGKAYNKGYDSSMAESKAKAAKEASATNNAPVQGKEAKDLYGKPTAKVQAVLSEEEKKLNKKKGEREGSGGITGGQQVRNITIQKIVFAENFSSTNAAIQSMTPKELERMWEEFVQRMMLGFARS
jgi:TP901 family phage tail tape measure protein